MRMILYVSESGGIVTKEYTGIPDEETQNLAAAKVIADVWGCVIALLQPSRDRGVKSADAIIFRGGCLPVMWEIKTNLIPTSRAIDNALRKAGKQADKMILHILSNISDEKLWQGIKNRLRQTGLQELAIIKGNNITLYSREQILAKR